MNMSNINVQLLTIEAAHSRRKEHVYHAAMMDPHTQAELSLDDIVAMVDELIEAQAGWLPGFH
jgi:alpha-galactosidase